MNTPLHTLHQKLAQAPSSSARAEVAVELAKEFSGGALDVNEKQIATEIFRLLVSEAEVQVRAMLSEHLAHCMDVPHDIVAKLARDVTEVAVHVLEHSYVLTEDDLIAITKGTQDVAVMSAIARRGTVSCELSQALLSKSNAVVIETLLTNKSANISDASLSELYASCRENHSVLELMVRRGGLPVTLAEKLFSVVSDEMKKLLTREYKLPMQVADSSTNDVREMATLGLLDPGMRTMDIVKLVDQLYRQGKLTLSMVIRSLCLGDMRFFEYALSRLSDVPIGNVQLLVLDQGENGFESLYKTTCLPMEMFPAMRYLLNAALEETSFGRYKCADFRKLLAERLAQDAGARKIDYMDYIITLIQSNARDTAIAS